MAEFCRSPAFTSGVAYAVSCLGQQDIVIKEKQSEAIKSNYEGKDVFTAYGVRKIAAYGVHAHAVVPRPFPLPSKGLGTRLRRDMLAQKDLNWSVSNPPPL